MIPFEWHQADFFTHILSALWGMDISENFQRLGEEKQPGP